MKRFTKRLEDGTAVWDYPAEAWHEDGSPNYEFREAFYAGAVERLAVLEDEVQDMELMEQMITTTEAGRKLKEGIKKLMAPPVADDGCTDH